MARLWEGEGEGERGDDTGGEDGERGGGAQGSAAGGVVASGQRGGYVLRVWAATGAQAILCFIVVFVCVFDVAHTFSRSSYVLLVTNVANYVQGVRLHIETVGRQQTLLVAHVTQSLAEYIGT